MEARETPAVPAETVVGTRRMVNGGGGVGGRNRGGIGLRFDEGGWGGRWGSGRVKSGIGIVRWVDGILEWEERVGKMG
jgi:hypothetical protein